MTWKGTVRRIEEDDSGRPAEVTLDLWSWLDNPPHQTCLPRAGEKYWLVSDALYKRLTGDDE